jgi:hypothetical protein
MCQGERGVAVLPPGPSPKQAGRDRQAGSKDNSARSIDTVFPDWLGSGSA